MELAPEGAQAVRRIAERERELGVAARELALDVGHPHVAHPEALRAVAQPKLGAQRIPALGRDVVEHEHRVADADVAHRAGERDARRDAPGHRRVAAREREDGGDVEVLGLDAEVREIGLRHDALGVEDRRRIHLYRALCAERALLAEIDAQRGVERFARELRLHPGVHPRDAAQRAVAHARGQPPLRAPVDVARDHEVRVERSVEALERLGGEAPELVEIDVLRRHVEVVVAAEAVRAPRDHLLVAAPEAERRHLHRAPRAHGEVQLTVPGIPVAEVDAQALGRERHSVLRRGRPPVEAHPRAGPVVGALRVERVAPRPAADRHARPPERELADVEGGRLAVGADHRRGAGPGDVAAHVQRLGAHRAVARAAQPDAPVEAQALELRIRAHVEIRVERPARAGREVAHVGLARDVGQARAHVHVEAPVVAHRAGRARVAAGDAARQLRHLEGLVLEEPVELEARDADLAVAEGARLGVEPAHVLAHLVLVELEARLAADADRGRERDEPLEAELVLRPSADHDRAALARELAADVHAPRVAGEVAAQLEPIDGAAQPPRAAELAAQVLEPRRDLHLGERRHADGIEADPQVHLDGGLVLLAPEAEARAEAIGGAVAARVELDPLGEVAVHLPDDAVDVGAPGVGPRHLGAPVVDADQRLALDLHAALGAEVLDAQSLVAGDVAAHPDLVDDDPVDHHARRVRIGRPVRGRRRHEGLGDGDGGLVVRARRDQGDSPAAHADAVDVDHSAEQRAEVRPRGDAIDADDLVALGVAEDDVVGDDLLVGDVVDLADLDGALDLPVEQVGHGLDRDDAGQVELKVVRGAAEQREQHDQRPRERGPGVFEELLQKDSPIVR